MMLILPLIALTGCSDQSGLTYDDISKRDILIAELSDKNAALEKRVRVLELQSDLHQAVASSDRREAKAAEAAAAKTRIVDEIVNDKRFRNIESDIATR